MAVIARTSFAVALVQSTGASVVLVRAWRDAQRLPTIEVGRDVPSTLRQRLAPLRATLLARGVTAVSLRSETRELDAGQQRVVASGAAC